LGLKGFGKPYQIAVEYRLSARKPGG
jgi:hypothetical protein